MYVYLGTLCRYIFRYSTLSLTRYYYRQEKAQEDRKAKGVDLASNGKNKMFPR